jgi:hypothetical protein
MKISEVINETASSGSTTSANMGTTIAGGTPPKGQFFGGDPASSIYTTIKKHRKDRKSKVAEDTVKKRDMLCECGHPKHQHSSLGCLYNKFLDYCKCEKFAPKVTNQVTENG